MSCNPHFGQADELIQTELAATGGSYLDPQTTALTIAGVQANLALAYEQRTANLITYWAAMTDEVHGYLDDEDKAQFRGIQEQITERLDLA